MLLKLIAIALFVFIPLPSVSHAPSTPHARSQARRLRVPDASGRHVNEEGPLSQVRHDAATSNRRTFADAEPDSGSRRRAHVQLIEDPEPAHPRSERQTAQLLRRSD